MCTSEARFHVVFQTGKHGFTFLSFSILGNVSPEDLGIKRFEFGS